jgi:electron transfer flavoprotein alpha subunit
MAIWIETDDCTGCRRCVKACPYGAVEVVDKVAVLDERCTGCGACIESCKHDCIKSDVSDEAPDLSGWANVLVFAEVREGSLHPAAFELLGCGAGLCKASGESLEAVVLGHDIEGAAKALLAHGAEVVHHVDHPELTDYRTLPYASVISRLIEARSPSIVLFSATHVGRDLAPRIARRLGVGLTADCTGLSIDSDTGHLRQTRPAFGGNVIATILSARTRPQMATVRPGVMAPAAAVSPGSGRIEVFDPQLKDSDLIARVIEKVRIRKTGLDIRDATAIVAGGRGVGSSDGFALLTKLAQALGAEVAGSRVAVELGWIPQKNQVGQTGHTVRPDLYIACGISGAVQHAAGMLGAATIVAINRDAHAPIFKLADVGIVGDLHKVVPEIIRTLGGDKK